MTKYISLFSIFFIAICSYASSVIDVDISSDLKNEPSEIHFSVTGDYDGDERKDTACIINTLSDISVIGSFIKISMEAGKEFTPNPDGEYLMLKLGNGNKYLISSYTGRFSSPSFELISEQSFDNKSAPQSDGDILILPSEAGIDEIVYFLDGEINFFTPQEIP